MIYAGYNSQMSSINAIKFENYILRIDCSKAQSDRTLLLAHNRLYDKLRNALDEQ